MSDVTGGDLWVRGGEVVSENGVRRADVVITGGVVAGVGEDLAAPEGHTEIDASGKVVAKGASLPRTPAAVPRQAASPLKPARSM